MVTSLLASVDPLGTSRRDVIRAIRRCPWDAGPRARAVPRAPEAPARRRRPRRPQDGRLCGRRRQRARHDPQALRGRHGQGAPVRREPHDEQLRGGRAHPRDEAAIGRGGDGPVQVAPGAPRRVLQLPGALHRDSHDRQPGRRRGIPPVHHPRRASAQTRGKASGEVPVLGADEDAASGRGVGVRGGVCGGCEARVRRQTQGGDVPAARVFTHARRARRDVR